MGADPLREKFKFHRVAFTVVLMLAQWLAMISTASAQKHFYEGKNILLVRATDAGGPKVAHPMYQSARPGAIAGAAVEVAGRKLRAH